MGNIKVNNGFFATVSEQIGKGNFQSVEQNILQIDEYTKRFNTKYVLSEDAVDIEGKILRAGKDKFHLENYIENQSGHKLLFIDEENQQHIAWAKTQGKNATWFINKNLKINLPKGVKASVAREFIKANYQILSLPCCVTIFGNCAYTTHVKLDKPCSSTIH